MDISTSSPNHGNGGFMVFWKAKAKSYVSNTDLNETNRKVCIFVIFRATGNVKDLLKTLFLTLEPPTYTDKIKKLQSELLEMCFCTEKA